MFPENLGSLAAPGATRVSRENLLRSSDPTGGAISGDRAAMATASAAGGGRTGASDRAARVARSQLEEALGKLDISEEEATPLVIDDREDDEAPRKWMLAGKVLYRNQFHINTMTNALRPAWGNPKGLQFKSVGVNMFVAEFETQRDRDRVWGGSPWHVSKNAVVLAEFDECMRPDELKFDRLQLWARIINLPFHMRNDTWGLSIARQIDKEASMVQFDHMGGFLRARVNVEVAKPLRRWILIESARRKKTDLYDIQYEQVPYLCFSCGRLGHSDLHCPTLGTRDENGDLPFGPKLRALEEYKASAASATSSKEQNYSSNSKKESRTSSSHRDKAADAEVNSPVKPTYQQKRKGAQREQEYRPVVKTPLLLTSGEATKGDMADDELSLLGMNTEDADGDGPVTEPNPKKKKPTPENSAEAAGQPCPSQ